MASSYLNLNTPLRRDIVRAAMESLFDVETDMARDSICRLKEAMGPMTLRTRIDQDVLEELNHYNTRINEIKAFLEPNSKFNKLTDDNGDLFISTTLGEILDRALEVQRDTLEDAITEPWYTDQMRDPGLLCLSIELVRELRNKVTDSVGRLVTSIDILNDLRRSLRQ